MVTKKKSTVKKSAVTKRPRIIVGMGTCGLGAGARDVFKSIEKELGRHKLSADVVSTGCIGMCSREVLVDVVMPGYSRVSYAKVKPDTVPQIIEEHVKNGKVVSKYAMSQMCFDGQGTKKYKDLLLFDDLDQNKNQVKLVTKNCGIIDPEDIDEYILNGGYGA